MSPNKRKIFASDTSDEGDSFKHRRSSLRVNLSYCANLTDSGNGSLWRTEIEADEKRIDTARISKRLSRSRRNDIYRKKYQFDSDNEEDLRVKSDTSKFAVNKDTNVSLHVKKGIQLKQLTVKLENINKKKTLEAKDLKDAILNKTKEIFNRENKLCKRTAMILKTEENYFADIHNTNVENKSVILDTMTNNQLRNKAIMEHEKCTNIVNNQQIDNQYSNIVTTPTSNNKLNSSKRRIDNSNSSKRVIDKSRLTQKQLFAAEDKKIEGQAKCRIIENIVLKEKFPLFSLRQADQDGSPILSGNNRRLSLLRTRSKHSQNQSENHNISFSTIHSQSIGAPIVSSTFNEDIVTENKNNSPCNETNNDIGTSCATHTTNKVISMEMTEVYGDIRISEKHLSLQNTNSNAVDNIDNNKKKKSKEKSLEQNKCIIQMQKNKNNSLVDKPTMQNNTTHFDSSCTDIASDQNIISMQTSSNNKMTVVIKPQLQLHERINKNRNEEQHMLFLSDSDNTIRSSLNVNTSLDAITEANKEENVQKTNYRVNNSNQEIITNNKESTALDDQYESSNITEISMKMNTSVNSMRETWQRSNHLQSLSLDKNDEDTTKNYPNMDNQHSLPAENKETNDIDFLENISLIQRLRNISTQNQVSYNNKLKISEMKEKVRTDNRSNDVKFQSDEYTNGDSYVKGTPYPISCSDLFRTQLKHRTLNLNNSVTSNNKLNSMDNKENIDRTKSDAS